MAVASLRICKNHSDINSSFPAVSSILFGIEVALSEVFMAPRSLYTDVLSVVIM
jgi:hypothetical protein